MTRNYVNLPDDAVPMAGFPYYITPGSAGVEPPRIYRRARNAEPQFLEVRSRLYDDTKKYHYTMLCVARKRYKVRVQKLVALTFLGPQPGPDYEVAHCESNLALLRDPSLYAADGKTVRLRWDTPEGNRADCYRLGTVKRHPDEVRERALVEYVRCGSHSAVARLLGVDLTTVRRWTGAVPKKSINAQKRWRRKQRKRVWFSV